MLTPHAPQPSAASDLASAHEAMLEFFYLAPIGLLQFRADGAIELANAAAARLLLPIAPDADMDDIYRLFSCILPDLRACVESFHPATGQILDQVQLSLPGKHTTLTLTINKLNPRTFMAVVLDITSAIAQEQRILADQHRLQAICSQVQDHAIGALDPQGNFESWNQSLAHLGGWPLSAIVGVPLASLLEAVREGATASQLVDHLLTSCRAHGAAAIETMLIRQNGGRMQVRITATKLPDCAAMPGGFTLVIQDLTQRRHTEALYSLAMIDPLTGAANRRAGDRLLQAAFASWLQTGRGFSLLMLDLDHFKTINDNWGHGFGDEALIAVTRACVDNLREMDSIIRWGGEEFIILLPNVSIDRASTIAERLRTAMHAIELDFATAGITASIGITDVREADENISVVLQRVDSALYAAKAAGRN